MPWATNLKTSLQNDEKAARTGVMERRADARPSTGAPGVPLLRTRLIAACGWPTEAAPQARRRAKR